jgi:rubrerythrin
MVWVNIDELEALRIGIQSEIDAYKYFRKSMLYFEDKDILDLLASLAREELRHRKQLEEQYRQLSGHRLMYIKTNKKPIRLPAILEGKSDVDILEDVIKHETESRNFYIKIASYTKDAKGRAMLEKLAEAEQQHIDILTAEYSIRKKAKQSKLAKELVF